ncbi:hypothetical protein [Streptomyces flavofungini]|uniref:hypothetical protein n=1 Tax=Streptomyces flavofungini TaxID=68200 RepID=UPI0019A8DF67|nr:hypothetical protein [Streptomyces flavofungini]GHC88588.1 hypothetical protein GCM10010349_75970 [Streptomyces flavofungini]
MTLTAHRQFVWASPLTSANEQPPSAKTAASLTSVLRACADSGAQREDLPVILGLSRKRDTPVLLRFLTWSVGSSRNEAARYEATLRSAERQRPAAVADWWAAARWFTARPHVVVLLMLADVPGSLARRVGVLEWEVAYFRDQAGKERERVRRFAAEVVSLRAQRHGRRACAGAERDA